MYLTESFSKKKENYKINISLLPNQIQRWAQFVTQIKYTNKLWMRNMNFSRKFVIQTGFIWGPLFPQTEYTQNKIDIVDWFTLFINATFFRFYFFFHVRIDDDGMEKDPKNGLEFSPHYKYHNCWYNTSKLKWNP